MKTYEKNRDELMEMKRIKDNQIREEKVANQFSFTFVDDDEKANEKDIRQRVE